MVDVGCEGSASFSVCAQPLLRRRTGRLPRHTTGPMCSQARKRCDTWGSEGLRTQSTQPNAPHPQVHALLNTLVNDTHIAEMQLQVRLFPHRLISTLALGPIGLA